MTNISTNPFSTQTQILVVWFLVTFAATWLVWRQTGFRAARYLLTLFLVQLLLNALWSVLFFGMRPPTSATIEIMFLWFAIAATLHTFRHRTAVDDALIGPGDLRGRAKF